MADSPTDKGGFPGAKTVADKGDLQGSRSAADKGDLQDLRPAGDKGDLQGLKAPADKGDSQNLKSAGLKATLPRLKILNLFENSNVRHLTAEDVYKMLLNEGMDIGLATVYRVLTQFETAGLLVRHHFESGKAVFELNQGGHHDHLVCMQCGHVEEFYDPEIEKRQDKIAQARGFNIQEHSLYLYATCTKDDCPHRGHQ